MLTRSNVIEWRDNQGKMDFMGSGFAENVMAYPEVNMTYVSWLRRSPLFLGKMKS